MSPVLDASALLALLRDEPGGDVIEDAVQAGASISAVNLAEVYAKLLKRGLDTARLAENLTDRPAAEPGLYVAPFDEQLSPLTAELRPLD